MTVSTKHFIAQVRRIIGYGVIAGAIILPVSTASAQFDRIIEQLDADGQARVIVQMKAQAESPAWTNNAPVALQRSAVREMRDSLEIELAKRSLEIERAFSSLPFVGLRVDREQFGALLTIDDVAGVYPVTVERKAKVEASSALEDQSLASSVFTIDVEDAWARGYDGEGLTVAVIDGGFAIDHPMLSGKAVGAACFSATFGGDTFTQCPSGQTPEIGAGAASNCPPGSDRCDHGTHVASTAVGNDGSNFGVARAADLMPIDIFSRVTSESACDPDPAPCELTDSLAVLDALNYVNENVETYNIAAVNLSLGGGENTGPCDSDPRKVVIDMLREKGVATAAASGNDGANGSINAPACISTAVGVGASNDGTGVASFSNFASFMDVMAPGVNIRAADASGGLVTFSGTSMAVPHVAGAYAVIRSAFDSIAIDDVDAAIAATGLDVSRAGQNFTLPKIQVHKAILELQGINIRVFNNVIGSRTQDVGESYIRLHNSSGEAGRARVTLRDAETGTQLGRWTSPNIPAHASFQFNVSRLESEAVADTVIARDDRRYYNLVVESGFDGSMQHVLWQRDAGVITNMTSCADGLSGGERSLLNVHSPSIQQYPSAVRVYNDSASTRNGTLDVYNASTGDLLGQWETPPIDAGAAYEASLVDIVADIDASDNATSVVSSLPAHLNIELNSDFNGYLQHTVRNIRSNVLTDMSTKCALGRAN